MLELHHSATIHIPLALAVLFPVSHVVVLLLYWKKWLAPKFWILNWLMSGIQLGVIYLAFKTGQRDIFFSSAPSELLMAHRQLAIQFTLSWVAIFCLHPLAYGIRNSIFSKGFHIILLALLALQLPLAIYLGRLGGQLVFGN